MPHTHTLLDRIKNGLLIAIAALFMLTIIAPPLVRADDGDGSCDDPTITCPIGDDGDGSDPSDGDDGSGYDSGCSPQYDELTDEQFAALTVGQYYQLCPDPEAVIECEAIKTLKMAEYSQMEDEQIAAFCGLTPDQLDEIYAAADTGSDSGDNSSAGSAQGASSAGPSLAVSSKSPDVCTAKLTPQTLKKLKIDGKKKIEARKHLLNLQAKKITRYSKVKSNVKQSLKAKIKTANKRNQKVAKAAGKKASLAGKIKLKSPSKHTSQLKRQVSSFRSTANNAERALAKAKKPSDAAAAICVALINTRPTFLAQQLKYQKLIDKLYVDNARYDILYQNAVGINKILGNSSAVVQAVVPTDTPASLKARITNLQTNLYRITPNAVNDNIAAGGKVNSLFDDALKTEYVSLSRTISGDSGQINTGFKHVKVKKPRKASKH